MENDSIRANGTTTLVDIWIDGKLRAICVEKNAIAAVAGVDAAAGMSDEDRCEFVRLNLPLIVSSVKARLSKGDGDPDSIVIDAGHLGTINAPQADRRKADRRTADRRNVTRPKEELPQGERRGGDRRKRQRRRRPGS